MFKLTYLIPQSLTSLSLHDIVTYEGRREWAGYRKTFTFLQNALYFERSFQPTLAKLMVRFHTVFN